MQETLHFDPQTGSLTSLRSKEEVHDYRYFPEPDLVPLVPTEEMIERARSALPELPAARLERFAADYELPPDTASVLVTWAELGSFYEEALAAGDGGGPSPGALARWTTGELVAALRESGLDDPVRFQADARLAGRVRRRWSSAGSSRRRRPRWCSTELVRSGGSRAPVVEAKGLAPIADERRARGDRRARDRGRSQGGRAGASRQAAGDRRARRRGHAGDEGTGGRRRGAAARAREARRS